MCQQQEGVRVDRPATGWGDAPTTGGSGVSTLGVDENKTLV